MWCSWWSHPTNRNHENVEHTDQAKKRKRQKQKAATDELLDRPQLGSKPNAQEPQAKSENKRTNHKKDNAQWIDCPPAHIGDIDRDKYTRYRENERSQSRYYSEHARTQWSSGKGNGREQISAAFMTLSRTHFVLSSAV